MKQNENSSALNSKNIVDSSEKLATSVENVAKQELNGFMDFITEQNVIGIAVGLAVGGAASKLAISFIDNVIMQPIGYLFGSSDGLRGWTIDLGVKNGQMVTWNLGFFLNDVLNFVVIAFVFYMVIKVLGLDSKGKKKK